MAVRRTERLCPGHHAVSAIRLRRRGCPAQRRDAIPVHRLWPTWVGRGRRARAARLVGASCAAAAMLALLPGRLTVGCGVSRPTAFLLVLLLLRFLFLFVASRLTFRHVVLCSLAYSLDDSGKLTHLPWCRQRRRSLGLQAPPRVPRWLNRCCAVERRRALAATLPHQRGEACR